jgi:AcrR family transcriptional regulator
MRSVPTIKPRAESTFIERARREQIAVGAIEVLAKVGYQGASLAAIADHVGVSKGVVSYHFGSKDELLRQVMQTVLEQAADFMTARVGAAATYTAALRSYVRSNLEFLGSNLSAVHALTEILTHVRADDGVSPLYAKAGAEAVDQLKTLLQRGQRAKEFQRFDPYVAAVSIRASIDAVTTLLRADPTMDLARYTRQLTALIERSVRL